MGRLILTDLWSMPSTRNCSLASWELRTIEWDSLSLPPKGEEDWGIVFTDYCLACLLVSCCLKCCLPSTSFLLSFALTGHTSCAVPWMTVLFRLWTSDRHRIHRLYCLLGFPAKCSLASLQVELGLLTRVWGERFLRDIWTIYQWLRHWRKFSLSQQTLNYLNP